MMHSVVLQPDQEFGISDFTRLLGDSTGEVQSALQDRPVPALRFRRLTSLERDQAVLTAIRELVGKECSIAGVNDPTKWEQGWGEVLDLIGRKGFDPSLLRPQYFKYDLLRLDGDYIKVYDRNFEYEWYATLRRIIFRKYLAQVDQVIEFGCGTGTSLLILHELFPRIALRGCDWATASQGILCEMARYADADIQGLRFNMLTLEGREQIRLSGATGIMTMHALEQLGTSYEPMLRFMCELQPKICLHVEPIYELYDETNLLDFLALRYHEKRNYLRGFLPALRELSARGLAEVLDVRRLRFGSLFNEGYSLVVWRPTTSPSTVMR